MTSPGMPRIKNYNYCSMVPWINMYDDVKLTMKDSMS